MSNKPFRFLNTTFLIIRPHHPQSWSFINKDIIPAIGIMAFGKNFLFQ